jgi:ABC-type nitrate/sulfonate/bicarbonate transport system substrate-binding protein
LLQGLNQAIDMINREPDKAAAVISAATGVPVDRERKNLGTIEWRLRLDAPIQDSLAQTADMLKEQNKLPAEADIRAAVDTTFVDRMP